MRLTTTVTLAAAKERVATQSGKKYFLLDFKEYSGHKDEKGNDIVHKWQNVFFRPEEEINLKELVETEVEIEVNFYIYNRKVGDVVYQDIKVNVLSVKPL